MKKRDEMSFSPENRKAKTIQNKINILHKKIKDLKDKDTALQKIKAEKINEKFKGKRIEVDYEQGDKKGKFVCNFKGFIYESMFGGWLCKIISGPDSLRVISGVIPTTPLFIWAIKKIKEV